MRLIKYILENSKIGRGKEISEKDALKLIPQYSIALKSIFNGKLGMGRTVWKRGLKYYLIDPKKSNRKSRNTYNYYTLILDNSKKWSRYPKRSKSIICRSIKVEPRYMNDPQDYLVLPKNGSKIGECPDNDFWFSFLEIGVSMNDLAQTLNYLLNYPNYTDEELEDKLLLDKINEEYDKSYSMFKKACKNFDDWVKNDTMFSTKEIKNIYLMPWLDNWNGKTPILKYLDDILDPKKHDFRVSTIKNISNALVEVWTDSECLMIIEPEVQKFLKMTKELI